MSKELLWKCINSNNNHLNKNIMRQISYNKNITKDFIEKMPSKTKWDWDGLSLNKNIVTIEMILDSSTDIKKLNWFYISKREDITLEIINNNKHLPWSLHGINRNPNITKDDIKQISFIKAKPLCFKHKCNCKYKWDINELLENETFMLKYPDFIWEYLMKNIDNPNIIWYNVFKVPSLFDFIDKEIESNETLQDHLVEYTNIYDIDESMVYLCDKMNIIRKTGYTYYEININQFLSLTHKNYEIANSKFIYWTDIVSHPEIEWDWTEVSRNPNITIEIVKSNLDKKWDWSALSGNPAISLDDIENNLGLPWEWNHIAANPNLTMDFLMKHNINPEFICCNQFNHHEYYTLENFKRLLVKKFMDTCFQELIEKTCTVSRKLNWDEDFMEDCKNDFYEGGREFYLAECRKYT